ncbi:MAG: hypothetical protein M5U12_12770 [Verrucomicrobia bacterium]|nr:hypothetical protein [Verrucomicrobiota bacterium]
MVHRNTLIATPTAVYYGDDTSCKVYDAATGALREEIVPPAELTDGDVLEMDGTRGRRALCARRPG